MNAVTRDVKYGRNNSTKSKLRRKRTAKRAARQLFRTRLKAADRRTNFDGWVRPTYTEWSIT